MRKHFENLDDAPVRDFNQDKAMAQMVEGYLDGGKVSIHAAVDGEQEKELRLLKG